MKANEYRNSDPASTSFFRSLSDIEIESPGRQRAPERLENPDWMVHVFD
jgi:hypothetical protein